VPPPGPRSRCRSRSSKTSGSRLRSAASPRMPGPRSPTGTPSTTKAAAAGCLEPRWPRLPTSPSRRARRHSRCRAGWGGPPHPRTQSERPRRTVRPVAIPRLLHHQQPGHRGSRRTHRGHAIIEQVHADLKNSALAHLPSGTFTANAAWLVLAVLAFNLTRARCSAERPAAGHRDHRHHPPHPHRGARPDRQLGPTRRAAPATRLALAAGLDPAAPTSLRAARPGRHLTAQPPSRPTPGHGTHRQRGRNSATP
jgi:hypothetical protein